MSIGYKCSVHGYQPDVNDCPVCELHGLITEYQNLPGRYSSALSEIRGLEERLSRAHECNAVMFEQRERSQETMRLLMVELESVKQDRDSILNDAREMVKEAKHYANRAMWKDEVINSYSGEVQVFDWDGDLADNPYDFADRILSMPLAKRIENEQKSL